MPGNFVAVECPDCENEQVLFGKAAGAVDCAVCGVAFDPTAAGPATSGANEPDGFGATGGQNAGWTSVGFRGAFGSGAAWNLADWALIAQDGTIQ